MDVPVSRFRAELKKWLDRAQKGEELVITEHGKPIARITGAKKLTTYDRLVREGVITPARMPKESVDVLNPNPVKPRKPVSPLISEMRDRPDEL